MAPLLVQPHNHKVTKYLSQFECIIVIGQRKKNETIEFQKWYIVWWCKAANEYIFGHLIIIVCLFSENNENALVHSLLTCQFSIDGDNFFPIASKMLIISISTSLFDVDNDDGRVNGVACLSTEYDFFSRRDDEENEEMNWMAYLTLNLFHWNDCCCSSVYYCCFQWLEPLGFVQIFPNYRGHFYSTVNHLHATQIHHLEYTEMFVIWRNLKGSSS